MGNYFIPYLTIRRLKVLLICACISLIVCLFMMFDMSNSVKTIEDQHTEKVSFLEAKVVSLETSENVLSNANGKLVEENTGLNQQITDLKEELASKPQ